MKKLVLLAASAALAACSQQAEKAAETETKAAEATAAAPADSATVSGEFSVKLADGTMEKTKINPDGTFVTTDAAGKETKGTFAVKDGKDCFDAEGDEAEVCWSRTEAAADGSFSATHPDGRSVTVTPVKQ